MYGLYPGALYPGYYGYLVTVPVEPEFPDSTCVTSGIKVTYAATACVEQASLVTACVNVQQVTSEIGTTTFTIACEIDVRGVVKYETLVCRDFVTSGVEVHYQEDVVVDEPTILSEVTTRCAVEAAISCNSSVTGEVTVRAAVESYGVEFCCCGA